MTLTIAAMPAYNEERAIAKVVLGCRKHVDKVVVVDDGSTDATAQIAEALGAHVVRHHTNGGYGAALRSCFETARELGADRMVIIDSDGQHNPAEIPKLIAPILAGEADMVNGSRHLSIKPQINADERRSMQPPSAFICVHPRLISIVHHSMEVCI